MRAKTKDIRMKKLIEIVKYNEKAFDRAMDFQNGIDENMDNFSHEDLCDKYEHLINELFGIVEPIYKILKEARLKTDSLAADSSTNNAT